MAFKGRGFDIAGGLPKPWYEKLKAFKQGLDLNDRQTVILALWALCEMGSKSPARVREAAIEVREQYKARVKRDPADVKIFSLPSKPETQTAEEEHESDLPRMY